MRAAPPARALSRSAGSWHAAQAMLGAASAGVATYWAGAQLAGSEPGPMLAALTCAAAAGVAAVRSPAEAPAWLAWDGAAWSMQPQAQGGEALAGQPGLMLDLGHWMLVRFVVDPAVAGAAPVVRWLPLSRRDAGPAWPALRVALHHHRPAAHPPGGPHPAGPAA